MGEGKASLSERVCMCVERERERERERESWEIIHNYITIYFHRNVVKVFSPYKFVINHNTQEFYMAF